MHRSDHSRRSSSSAARSSTQGQVKDDSRDNRSAGVRTQSPSGISKGFRTDTVPKATDGSLAGASFLVVSGYSGHLICVISTGASGPSAGDRAQTHAVASSTLHQSATPSKASFSPFSRTARSSSPSFSMGQVQSDLRGPPRLPSPQVEPQPSSSMSQKLRLAWPVRRKKTLEPASALASPVSAQHQAEGPDV